MRRVSMTVSVRYALGIACGVWALSVVLEAGQAVSVSSGVYSDRQADRAKSIYEARCVSCHGDKLQGGIGPPLAGPDFLSTWSGRPLSDVVDKIKTTMPFNEPGTLSPQESLDLTAYILRGGGFPSAQADLTDSVLAVVTLPTVRAANTATAPRSSSPGLSPPVGNLAEVMRSIAFYNSNIIFNLPLKDPTNAPKKPFPVPFDYVEWGYTIYPGWLAVDQAAVALTETAPLLLTPGRRCQNGRPVPLDRADWKEYVDNLAKVGNRIYAASKARKYDELVELSDVLNDACANCHKVYRDNGGREGSGANRCQAVP